MKKLVVLSGAGVSAESGIKTFRDSGGLWEGYKIEEVATYDAWLRNPTMVQDFYNMRRKNVLEVNPNEAHYLLKELENRYHVQIITQNVDNLHERAGSKNVLHLHGLITQAKSTINDSLIYDIDGWELKMGEVCELGSQLRPNIVWFGESVPAIEQAVEMVQEADMMLVIGTSLQVYPAAGLLDYFNPQHNLYVIDPNPLPIRNYNNLVSIQEVASKGMQQLLELI
ncbi:MAG: Sir2 family NAD-dependent protein deacetylase [Bacteroidota bacterium]